MRRIFRHGEQRPNTARNSEAAAAVDAIRRIKEGAARMSRPTGNYSLVVVQEQPLALGRLPLRLSTISQCSSGVSSSENSGDVWMTVSVVQQTVRP